MEISGPDAICFSWSLFSVDNLPSGDSISWDQSDNISRLSQQGSNPCIFRATDSGSAWVEATINTACGSITLPRKEVWVGVPDWTLLDVDLEGGVLVACGDYIDGTARYNGSAGIDAYEWRIIGTDKWEIRQVWGSFFPFKNVEIKYWEDPAPSQEDIYIRAHNSCGWSDWQLTTWPVEDNCN